MSETTQKSSPIALAPAPTTPRPPVPAARRSDMMAPARRALDRVQNEWAPLVVWHVGRSGRTGLVGIGLALAAAVFFFSTHMQVANEAAALGTAEVSLMWSIADVSLMWSRGGWPRCH